MLGKITERITMKLRKNAMISRGRGRLIALCAAGLMLSSHAGGISSMSTSGHFDTHDVPLGRAVGGDGTVPVSFAGGWFESGECELYVDGVLVATSTGPLQTYALAGAADTWKTYRLTLKSAEGEQTKVVTLYPYAGYVCPTHSLSASSEILDARPADKARKVHITGVVPITWSGMWTNEADRAVVRLYSGVGTNGTLVAELASEEGREEGCITLAPSAQGMEVGKYTLTHYDGVETLVAYLRVYGGMALFLK